MKIISQKDVNTVAKPEGTTVSYYLFDEYEVMYNEQAPGTTQTWHHHEKVWETLLLISGSLTAKWRDADGEHSQILKAGDLVEVENTPHTFENHTNDKAVFVVLKQILTDENHRQTFKDDKILD